MFSGASVILFMGEGWSATERVGGLGSGGVCLPTREFCLLRGSASW